MTGVQTCALPIYNGFAVTWHSSKQAADKSALGFYSWDKLATLVGVFQVEGN